MKHSLKFVVVCLSALLLVFAWMPRVLANEAEDKAKDIAQMKKVWEALMAYKKAKGELPDKLSEIVPEFLADPKVLLSPRDNGAQENGPLTRKDPKHPSSYGYEWGSQMMNTATFKEVKSVQLEEYGPLVPLLRCFLYDKVVNVSHSGEVYESALYWETSPELKELIKKHGLGPGAAAGKFLDVTAVDPDGKPVQGVRVTAAARQIRGLPLPDRTVTTNGEGKVRIPFGSNPTRTGILSFSADRHFAMPIVSNEAGFEETLLVKMTLARHVSGVIRDAAGKPIAGAKIQFAKVPGDKPAANVAQQVQIQIQIAQIDGGVRARSNQNQLALVESGTDGAWSLKSLPEAEEKIEVTVSHPEFRVVKGLLGESGLTLESLLAGKGDFVLQPPIQLKGHLRDANGAPISKATIFLRTPPDPLAERQPAQAPETKTDEEGRFEFTARVAGDSHLVALAKGHAPLLHAFELKGEPELLAVSPPQGRKITGVVMDTTRKPVPDVPILFTGWPSITLSENPVVATTDEAGNWVWNHAPPETVRGTAMLPSGRLWYWNEQKNQPVEIKIPLTERE